MTDQTISETVFQSEQWYRSLFEDSRDAILISERDGGIIEANQAACELFGYSRGEIVGIDVRSLYAHPTDRARFKEEIEKHGFVRDYEVKLRTRDGDEIDCLLTTSVRKDTDGNVLGYQGIVRDVTDRKSLEDKLLSLGYPFNRTCCPSSPFEVAVRARTGHPPPPRESPRHLRQPTSVRSVPQSQHGADSNRFRAPTRLTPRRKASETDGSAKMDTPMSSYQGELRSLAAQMGETEERERRRIAEGLHDQVGQTLALANLKLETLRVSTSDQERAELMDQLLAALDQMDVDVRSLTFELSPFSLAMVRVDMTEPPALSAIDYRSMQASVGQSPCNIDAEAQSVVDVERRGG